MKTFVLCIGGPMFVGLCVASAAVAQQPAPTGARYSERDVWLGAPAIYGGPGLLSR